MTENSYCKHKMEMKCTGPIEMAEEQLPIAIAYLEDADRVKRKLQRKIERKKRKLDMLIEKLDHIDECIDSCQLEIETFQEILERGF